MKKKKNIIFTIIFIFLLGSVFNVQKVIGETRNALLLNFIKENQSLSGGFYESSSGNQQPSLEATRAAVSILTTLNKLDDIEVGDAETWIVSEILSMINNDNNSEQISLALESLQLVSSLDALGANPVSEIRDFLESMKIVLDNDTVGYSLNEEGEASVFGTYFALNCYYYIGNSSTIIIINNIDRTEVENFILSCQDTNGGFKSDLSEESSSSLINTYFALHALNLLGNFGNLDQTVKNDALSYINSFYIDDKSSEDFGGFSFNLDGVVPHGSFYATYLASYSLNMIDNSIPTDDTVNWVLDHQNTHDGGFSEVGIQDGISNSSSISSYYAIEILKLKNTALSMLNVEMLGRSVNWGLILGITIPAIVLIIAGIVFYKRKTAL